MTKSSIDTFDVYIFKKTPYFTRFLGITTIILLIFVAVGLSPLMPSKHYTDEVRILYFMVLYPDKLKIALFIGIPSLIIFWQLYVHLRLKKNATLTFDAEKIELIGKDINIVFPVNKIRYINIYDPHNGAGNSKENFSIELWNWDGTKTKIHLTDYLQATRLFEALSVYEDIKLEVFSDYTGRWDTNDKL